MLDFIRLGREQAPLEPDPIRRLACRLLGRRGLGYAVKLWALQSMLEQVQTEPGNILDFGCSSGAYSFYLNRRFPTAGMHGIDGDSGAVQHAQQIADTSNRNQMRFEAMRFEAYQPATTHDLVVSLDAIHYTPEADDVVSKLCRSVADDGYLILSCPRLLRYYSDGFNYYLGWIDVKELAPLYSCERISGLIEQEGLTIVDQFNFPSDRVARLIARQSRRNPLIMAMYPAMITSAWWGRRAPGDEGTHYMILAKRTTAIQQPQRISA